MNQIRTQLTRLKNKVIELLPDEPDIFKYPGVTKAGVLECLETAYSLTNRIEELKGAFPIVALKRKIQPHLDTCKAYLETEIEGKKSVEKFDGFLRAITKIHDEIALTHTIYLSGSLRSEAELEGIRVKTREMQADFEAARPDLDKVIEALEQISELHASADENASSLEEALTDALAKKAALEKAANEASATAQLITKYESETKTQKNEIVTLASKLTASEKKLQGLLKDSQAHVRESEENLKKISELEAKNVSQQNSIAQTLTLASKYGMAASFKERKDELKTPMLIWGIVFSAAMIGIFATGAYYIVPQFKEGQLTVTGLVVKLSLVAPLVWLGWMSAKQYGYLSRIWEDYSFKYASALAFEGYKREAIEVNKDMLEELLSVATENMSLNPLRIYGDDDDNHASPVQEMLAKLVKKDVSKAPNIRNKGTDEDDA